MTILTIVVLICVAVVVGGLVWFAQQNPLIRCCSNGCTGDCTQGRHCDCAVDPADSPWPFPKERP